MPVSEKDPESVMVTLDRVDRWYPDDSRLASLEESYRWRFRSDRLLKNGSILIYIGTD